MNSIFSTVRSPLNRVLMTLATFAVASLVIPTVNAQSGTQPVIKRPPVRTQSGSGTTQSGSGTTQSRSNTSQSGSGTTQSGSNTSQSGSGTTQSGSDSKPAGGSSTTQSGSATQSGGSGPKTGTAPIGLEGYCPLCIVKIKQWVKGSSQYPFEYDGKTYLFPAADQKQAFMQDPAKYAPILGGDCIVAKVELGKRIPGSVQHAALHRGHLYLFANAQAKEKFRTSKEKYVGSDLAFGGKCSVCLVEMNKQMNGDPAFTTMYKGMRYLFPSKEQQTMFASNPSKYEDKK